MAIAKTWGCTVGSDDLRAVRKYCEENNIELIGCLGILYDAYESDIIKKIDGDKILVDMINKTKYKCPVTTFQEIIDYFKKGIGRKLY